MPAAAPINVALAGISGYGGSYLDALLDDPRAASVTFVGAVEPAPGRCKRLGDLAARGVPIHAGMEGLFAATPRVDLMLIATPIHFHAPQTCYALARGASVLCEKPIGATVRDAVRIAAAERGASGRFVAIGFQWSFSPAVQGLKHDIRTGLLGRPRRLKCLVIWPRPRAYFTRNSWAGRLYSQDGHPVFDGPANNAAAHFLHNILYLLGPTRSTSLAPATVQSELYRANDIESYDTAALRCRFPGGAEALFYATHAAGPRRGPVCHYEFEHATVTYDHGAGDGEFVATFKDGSVKNYGNPNADRHANIWQCVDAVRSGLSLPCTAEAATPHALTIAAAHRAARTITTLPAHLRRTVELPEGPMTSVDGLAEVLTDCYDRAILPGEVAAFSSRPGRTLNVRVSPRPRSNSRLGSGAAPDHRLSPTPARATV